MDDAVLITGATGLIGSALARSFASDGVRVVAAARDAAKAEGLFSGVAGIDVVRWDVLDPAPGPVLRSGATMLVHAASETSSRAFVERPVETIRSVLRGTENALDAARARGARSMAFLSSMEVYGTPTAEPVTECDYGFLDPLSVRSSYPEAKRMAECMCVAYAKEFGVPVKIARLAQTFGEGVRYDDGRVFAEFARAVLERRDITLKTDGATARCYCYIGDAVDAVRTILERGEVAAAYTVANEDTFCTVREMAERLVAAFPDSGSRVVFDPSGAERRGFAPQFRMRLDSSRLRRLGWSPKVGLVEMFGRMMSAMGRKEGGCI